MAAFTMTKSGARRSTAGDYFICGYSVIIQLFATEKPASLRTMPSLHNNDVNENEHDIRRIISTCLRVDAPTLSISPMQASLASMAKTMIPANTASAIYRRPSALHGQDIIAAAFLSPVRRSAFKIRRSAIEKQWLLLHRLSLPALMIAMSRTFHQPWLFC